MKDKNTTVAELRKRIIDFRDERNWKEYHKTKDLLLSAVIEMGELLEHFQWRSETLISENLKDKKEYDEIRFELADVLVYLISFANSTHIDISQAIDDKLIKAAKKFPVDQVKKWSSDTSEHTMMKEYQQIRKEYKTKELGK